MESVKAFEGFLVGWDSRRDEEKGRPDWRTASREQSLLKMPLFKASKESVNSRVT